MSVAASSSIRAMAGSIDGALAVRVPPPFILASSTMLGRYVADRQRNELVACGHPTTTPQTSPREDIKAMKKKLKAAKAAAAAAAAAAPAPGKGV